MSTALRRMLTVHKRKVTLPVTGTMRDGHLNILAGEMDRLIKRRLGHVFVQQIEQSVFRSIVLPVELDRQPQIEVSIVLDQVLDILKVVMVLTENCLIDHKLDQRTVTLVDPALPNIILLNAGRKPYRMRLTIPDTAGHKATRKHIHRLHTDSVQSNRLDKSRGTVLSTGIHHRYGRSQTLQRNTTSVIANPDRLVLDRDLDQLASSHDELIDRVVHHLFDQHINSIIGRRSIPQFTDIHPRSQSNMLPRTKGFDIVVRVIRYTTHVICSYFFSLSNAPAPSVDPSPSV